MNERIKELMPKPWTFPYPDRELYTKEQFEKFAQMIVQRCTELSDLAEKNCLRPGTVIKRHFGVEE